MDKFSKKGLTIRIWGTRGSLPAPETPLELESRIRGLFREFFESGFRNKNDIDRFLMTLPPHRLGGYGGNTLCVEVRSAKDQVIIDGGSAIRLLGYELLKGPCGTGQGEVHIVFTHFHWDHLIGIPFFAPIFMEGNKIHVYSVQEDLKEIFYTLFKKPLFPVSFEDLRSKIIFHKLKPRKVFRVGEISITPYMLDHPDPCWGYRFERDGRVYSHCIDTECTRFSRESLDQDIGLYKDVDLMAFDAQYTLMETIEKVNWGHASATLGIDIAMREKIKKVIFLHFDPAASIEKIAQAEAQARKYYEAQLRASKDSELKPVRWSFATEGMILEV